LFPSGARQRHEPVDIDADSHIDADADRRGGTDVQVAVESDAEVGHRSFEAWGDRLAVVLALIGRTAWAPWEAWIRQPLLQRRRQVLLGFGLAPFLAMLLAIALGGVFVRLLVVAVVFFAGFLAYATLVGQRELRAMEDAARSRFAAAGYTDDEVDRLAGGGLGLFDAGFFEPIPELASAAEAPRSSRRPAVRIAGHQAQKMAERSSGHDDSYEHDGHENAREETAERERVEAVPFTPPAWSQPSRRGKPRGRPIYFGPEGDEVVAGAEPESRAASE
jgi:hypothetical protein